MITTRVLQPAPVVALALILAACAAPGAGERSRDTTIRSIERQGAPDDTDLSVRRSEPVEASPEMALENYRRLMELSPTGDTRAEAQRRMADLQVQLDDIAPDAQSERRLREAVTLYQQLLRDRPNDPGNDRVIYQLARAQQNLGEVDASVDSLARLVEQFPRSPYAADGRFRRAELLFATRRFDEAVPEYEAVIELGGQTPFFEAAQYKYGWSLYRLSRFHDALEVFFTILDRELPEGEPADPTKALAEIPSANRDLTRDVIRVSGLSYIALGGGSAVGESFDRLGEPRFYPLLFRALGEMLLDRERYSDAAESFYAFVQRYPRHALAPDFQESVIAAYETGGFPELVIAEKERYVDTYDPRADYWGDRRPDEAVLASLRTHLGDLSTWFHGRAQERPRQADWPSARQDYLTAASWYERTLQIFPEASDAPEVHYRFAETLYEGGEILRAAQEYHNTAYDYARHDRSSDAGYAAVLTYYEAAEGIPPEDRPQAYRQAVDEALQFAGAFLDHPERLPVLTRAAEDLFTLEEYEDAIAIASRVLRDRQAPRALVRTALTVRADAEFTLERFPDAEGSYLDLLAMVDDRPDEAGRVADQLALSIYRQGEAEQERGNHEAAVSQFMRIGMVTPDAAIRPNAEYDAAILLTEAGDWSGAARVLEGFRGRFRDHELVPDADKQLATAYERSDQPIAAAGVYLRIAERGSENREIREEAAWTAAALYDEGGDSRRAADAYRRYMESPLRDSDRETRALERLIALSETQDPAAHRNWLARAAAGGRGTGADANARSQLLAAQANLALGEMAAKDAAELRLRQPLQSSLAERRRKVDEAADKLGRAAEYGFEEVTPQATHALGELYRSFAKALIDSERPRGLDAAARDEYELLLEDQAFPLEERAIDFYEANLRRIPDGVWNDSVRASWRALTDMVPARYARNQMLEQSYDSLR